MKNPDPIVVMLAAKLFWRMTCNGPTAAELDAVIYPAVSAVCLPGGPQTYGELMARISGAFAGAAWVEKAFRDTAADCAGFTDPADCFETPTGRTLPLAWVKL